MVNDLRGKEFEEAKLKKCSGAKNCSCTSADE